MDLKEAKKWLKDCEYMRTYFRHEVVDAVQWLMRMVEELEQSASQPAVQADAEPCSFCGYWTRSGAKLCPQCGRKLRTA